MKKLVICGLIVGLIGAAFIGYWMDAQCHLPKGREIIIASNSIGCWDYWLNRYQAFLAGGLALLAAGMAAHPVWKQLFETQRQVDQQQLQLLKQRGVELNQERDALSSVMAQLDVTNSMVGYFSTIPKITPTWLKNELSAVLAADEILEEKTKDFIAVFNKIWGRAEVQRLRDDFMNHIYRVSNAFADLGRAAAKYSGNGLSALPEDAMGQFLKAADEFRHAHAATFALGVLLDTELNRALKETKEAIMALEGRIIGLPK